MAAVLIALFASLLPPSRGRAYVGTTAMGGLYGGEIDALAVSPVDPSLVLASTTQGVFRSETGGARWRPASAGLRHLRVKDVTFDVEVPTRAYAATNTGVFRSLDGGASWEEAYSTADAREHEWAQRVVSTPGTLYAATSMRLLASDDAGVTWRVLYNGYKADWRASIVGMGAAPSDPDVVYVSRQGDGANHDLLRSRNGGETWQMLSIKDVIDVEVQSDDPQVVYANRGGEVVVSRDGGNSWTTLSDYSQGSVDEMSVSGGTVALSGFSYEGGKFVARSADGGLTWTTSRIPASQEGLVTEALALDPTNDMIVYYGGRGTGVWRSIDGAATFAPRNVGLTALPVRGIATDPTDPTTMYATLGDGGIFRSDDGGMSWVDVTAGLRDPDNPYHLVAVNRVVTGADGAVYVTRVGDRWDDPPVWASTDRGLTWEPRSDGLALKGRTQFLLAHPTKPGHLVVTSSSWGPDGSSALVGRAFRTENGGRTWTQITELQAGVSAAAVDGSTGRLLVATNGERDRLWESSDFGESWRQLTYPFDYGVVYSLAVDPRTGRIYGGGDSYAVAHSDDRGDSWTEADVPLSRYAHISVIAVDPLDATQVFAGTQGRGLWFSRDRGMTWAPATPGVDGQDVYAVMFPRSAATTSGATYSSASVGSAYMRYRAAHVGTAHGTRSGLVRMMPRPHNRSLPAISGRPRVGRVLRCDPGRWSRATRFRYRWLRDGVRIDGATTATHEVVRRDRDHALKCRVVAGGPGGRDKARSRRLKVP